MKMITQVKKWGDSKAIILSKEFCKYHKLDIDDWVDIGDLIKIEGVEL